MARLPRPYIPIAVRVQVAERQIKELGFGFANTFGVPRPLSEIKEKWARPSKALLDSLLKMLFGGDKFELHHRPALVNRRRKRNGDYDPPANHPDHLVYLPADEHDIETRVRGLHGQHSDLGLARKRKRAERKGRPKVKIRSRGFRKIAKQRRRQLPLPPRKPQ